MENYCVYEMKVLVFMALVQTFACSEPPRSRSVNVALETVVEFDNNDNSADIQIIDKVRRFLSRVKHVMDKNKGYRRSSQRDRLKFTDFLKHTLGILSSYEDSDLEDVISIFNEELRKYHYKDCKFYELVESTNVRRSMANSLEKIKNAPAKDVKQQLKKMLKTFENNKLGLVQKVTMDYVNSLYGDKSEGKLRDVLDKLAAYRSKTKRANLNLVKVIRDGVRSVIFDHYSGLDYKTRRDLKLKLETFWKDFDNPERNEHHVWNYRPGHKIDKSNKNFKDDEGSTSLETRPTTKHRKRDRHNRQNKAKRERDEHSTKRRLTFITLYPEAITVLETRKQKAKLSKTTKLPKHLRGGEKPKNKIKHKSVKKIITEHEAVINVEKDAVSRVLTAFDGALGYLPRQMTHLTTKRPRKIPKRSQSVIFKKRASYHTKYETTKSHQKQYENVKNLTSTFESDEGLSIKSFEDNDFEKHSFRKSNLNETLYGNNTIGINKTANQNSSSTSPDVNVMKRINDLEKELRVVKAQMKVTKDSHELTRYDHLDFWEGTTKDANASTPKSTLRTTSPVSITTTANTEATTTIVTTTKPTTKVFSSTLGAVFRSKITNESDFEKKLLRHEKKTAEKKVAEKTEEKIVKNMTGVIRMSNVNFLEPITLNHSAEIDYFNDIKEPEMNITGIKDIEKYLNESKPIGDSKNHHIVRKQMLEQLKGIFSGNPEDDLNSTTLLPSTPSMHEQDVTLDQLNMLDMDDDF